MDQTFDEHPFEVWQVLARKPKHVHSAALHGRYGVIRGKRLIQITLNLGPVGASSTIRHLFLQSRNIGGELSSKLPFLVEGVPKLEKLVTHRIANRGYPWIGRLVLLLSFHDLRPACCERN